jgi:nucleotide-binding universal stress UspA family protein
MVVVDKILVARDFTSASTPVLYHGLVLASKMKARLDVLHVTSRANSPYPARDLGSVRKELRRAGMISEEALESVIVEGVTRKDDGVANTIVRYAAEEEIDLIALGTRGRRGPRRALLGSVAEAVVRHADRPVLTVRGEGNPGAQMLGQIECILVPVDFSEHAQESIRVAAEWAKLYDAKVELLHVLTEESLSSLSSDGEVQSPDNADTTPKAKARQALATIGREVSALNVPLELYVQTGSPATAITEFVETRNTDLVVMATHGRTGVERFLLGSVAETTVRHVPCPVLTVRAFGRSIRVLPF